MRVRATGIAAKNVFLTVAGDAYFAEEYRLHPLFKDFLQRRLRSEIGLTDLNRERNRIADFFLAEDQWEKALPFFLESENFEKAAEIIAANGANWLAGGAIMTLDGFIEQIPLEFLEKFPRALLHKAEIARLQGDAQKSSNILNRAVKLLHLENDKLGEAEALHSLASLARRKGKCEEAFEFLGKAEKLVGEDTETFIKCANTRGLCLIAQGAWTNAEQQFRFALELAEKNSNEQFIRIITHNLALAPGFRGDFGEALRWLKRIFRDEKSGKQLPQESIGHLNMSRLHLLRGEFEEAEKNLERALELCQLYNLKSLRGEIFETYGNFYRETGDAAHASEFYERASKAYEDAGINIATRDLDEERAKFYLQNGDLVKARGLFKNLIETRRKTNYEIGMRRAHFFLMEIRFLQNDTENLLAETAGLLKFFHDQTLFHDEAMTSLLLANIHFKQKKRKEMMPHLQRALDLAARFDYEYWLGQEIKKYPDLFKDEDIIEKLPLDLRDNLAAAKPQIKAQNIQIIESAEKITDLTIKVLGHVDIFRDRSKPFAADAWTTRRARDIFCHITTSPHRRVSKDILIDEFWKDEDLSAIEKNFHPTISHIRKALNSRQTFKQNFIVFRDGAYQLNPELSYSIDTEEFEGFITDAEKAKKENDTEKFLENLESAHELYRGEFMSGIYEDWAEEKRNYFAEQHLRVLNALAKISFKEKNWSDALKFANQILHMDPFREDAHRLIMKTFAKQGKNAKISEQYQDLKNNLKKELGVPPSSETQRLFLELTKK